MQLEHIGKPTKTYKSIRKRQRTQNKQLTIIGKHQKQKNNEQHNKATENPKLRTTKSFQESLQTTKQETKTRKPQRTKSNQRELNENPRKDTKCSLNAHLKLF